MSAPLDVHQHVTDLILAQFEQATSEVVLPWQRTRGLSRPINVASGQAYSGINILSLWAAAEPAHFSSGIWATYDQWAEQGADVRSGEEGSLVVFYENLGASSASDSPKDGQVSLPSDSRGSADWAPPRIVARGSFVFAAEQVSGYVPPHPNKVDPATACARAELFIAATAGRIVHGGERAFYRSLTDTIHMPPRDTFIGSRHSTPAEAYYSTAFHELIHWACHPTRYKRDLTRRFGKQSYAEELVAELGAVFICAEFGLTPTPRLDHAQYLKPWLELLRSHPKAIFTVADKASAVAAFLRRLQAPAPSSAAASNSLRALFGIAAASRGSQPR